MRLPNKVITYNESVLPTLPLALLALREKDLTPKELYERLKGSVNDIGEFVEVIDCLYALGRVELDSDRGVLCYVNGNIL